MNEIEATITASTAVLLVIPIGRNTWAKKESILHYEANRLMKAEGVELKQSGTGVTGTLYVVKEWICRDNRQVMRVERQKIVNGKIVDTQNWGEIEEAAPRSLSNT